MTELIELRPLKTVKPRRSHKRSYTYTKAQALTDSSDDENSSSDESTVVLQLPSKSSKRNNMIQTLPMIINTQPVKQKKKSHKKHIQQFVINNQPPPSSPKKKEILINPMIQSSLSPAIQYVPVSAPATSLATIVERNPFAYQRAYTPTFIEEHPFGFYNSYRTPVRQPVRAYPSNTRSVRLPKHAQKLVNRFLSGMEHAHGRRYVDGSDSDHSIDDCKVCRQVRSAMNEGRRRSYSDVDLYHGSRVLFEAQDSHTHKYGHSKNCKVCSLLENSDFSISTTKNSKKKREKHVHIVEGFSSKIRPVEQTTTTTTTATQPKTVVHNSSAAVSSAPIQSSYYPMSYPTYVDPNTGVTYVYDPNWPYNSSGTGMNYDYSSYYTNPTYIQSNPQYEAYNTTVPIVTDSSNPTAQHTQTTTVISPNPLRDKGTYTYMPTNRKKHKPTNKTVVVHTARNPTPPTPKIIIEQRSPRLPRKLKSTTILKERTTQTPHTITTTYVRT